MTTSQTGPKSPPTTLRPPPCFPQRQPKRRPRDETQTIPKGTPLIFTHFYYYLFIYLILGVVRRLSLSVREQLFLPGDTIIDLGESNARVFYIVKVCIICTYARSATL